MFFWKSTKVNLEGQIKIKAVLPKLDCASEPHIELVSTPYLIHI